MYFTATKYLSIFGAGYATADTVNKASNSSFPGSGVVETVALLGVTILIETFGFAAIGLMVDMAVECVSSLEYN